MHKERKFRTASSLAVAIALSVAVFLLFFSIELLAGYLSPRLFQESLRLSDYGTGMEQEMLQKQKELFSSYGLPESLTEEIWDENAAYLAFYKYVDGSEMQDGEQFGQREVIEKYLKEQDVYETESVKEASDILASESAAICSRYIYPSFVTEYQSFIQERKPLFFGIAVASAVFAVLFILILFRWHHSRRHALRYVAGGFFTAAVWNIACVLAVRFGGWFSISGVASADYEKFLDTLSSRSLYPFYLISAVAAVLTVFLWIAVLRMRKHE